MNRDEYLAKAKERALKYYAQGDYLAAVTSMMSDMSGHPELRNHSGNQIGDALFASPLLIQDNPGLVQRYIEGYR